MRRVLERVQHSGGSGVEVSQLAQFLDSALRDKQTTSTTSTIEATSTSTTSTTMPRLPDLQDSPQNRDFISSQESPPDLSCSVSKFEGRIKAIESSLRGIHTILEALDASTPGPQSEVLDCNLFLFYNYYFSFLAKYSPRA